MLGFGYRWQPRWITALIILLCLCGIFFLWKESLWYAIVSIGLIYLLNYFLSALDSDGFKAAKIFNLYKEIISIGIDKDEKAIILRTARAYYIYKKMPNDYIDKKLTEIRPNNIIELVQYILISEGDYSNREFSVEKMNKVIRLCYRKVLKRERDFKQLLTF